MSKLALHLKKAIPGQKIGYPSRAVKHLGTNFYGGFKTDLLIKADASRSAPLNRAIALRTLDVARNSDNKNKTLRLVEVSRRHLSEPELARCVFEEIVRKVLRDGPIFRSAILYTSSKK
ncbi:hypothetical protein CCR75_009588 [Bremia lactucae]|uniref:Uncharacterized protein n=1 Tax=Bremia lactucae TaxID=4779 RepID=A0A976FFG4_BRELC|nr:hypothetical protein CCR75_009588 [Bremia lactucae]